MDQAQLIGIGIGIGALAFMLIVIFIKANMVICRPNEVVWLPKLKECFMSMAARRVTCSQVFSKLWPMSVSGWLAAIEAGMPALK